MKNLEYNWNNLVNLINSIKSFAWVNISYPELELLKSEELKKYDNVVLFLIDWLWYNWLLQYWKWSFLYSNLKWQINSVFPSTTTSSITTINTWFSPSEHAIVWRNMFSKEFWSLIQIFPWKHKISKTSLWDNILASGLSNIKPFYEESKKDIFIVTNELYKNSKYNDYHNAKTKTLHYNDLPTLFSKTIDSINYNKKQKYIFSYWPDFDTNCHDFWIDSIEAFNHFQDIDNHFENFYKSIKDKNTLVIVTADHGQINSEKFINLKEEYKHINDMLLFPLSWETRCQYCFVKEWFKENFYYAVKNDLFEYCEIFTKKEVLDSKLFWYWQDEKFLTRIWDFVILPKEWVEIWDWTDWVHVWIHGWISTRETKIPLIYF